MQIDLTPSEAARLGAAAQRAGLAPAELVKRLAFEHLTDAPAPVEDALDARLRQWQEQDEKPLTPDIPARTMFDQWAEEDASMTDADRGAEDHLWEEFPSVCSRVPPGRTLRSVDHAAPGNGGAALGAAAPRRAADHRSASAGWRVPSGRIILAAQALSLGVAAPGLIVATTNPAHLSRLVPCDLWTNIAP
jgi:hypothetical protein